MPRCTRDATKITLHLISAAGKLLAGHLVSVSWACVGPALGSRNICRPATLNGPVDGRVGLAWARNKRPVVVHACKCRRESWCWGNYIILWYFISSYYPEGVGRRLSKWGHLGTIPRLLFRVEAWSVSSFINMLPVGCGVRGVVDWCRPFSRSLNSQQSFQPWCGHLWRSRRFWRGMFSPRQEVLVDLISSALAARSSSLSEPTQLSTRECCSHPICIRLLEEAPSM